MSGLTIDRLALQVPGLSAADGQRLALLVARGLGGAGEIGGPREIPSIRLDLIADEKAGVGVEGLAARIVEQVLREIGRTP